MSRHRSNICRKLGARTILEAAKFVWETRYPPRSPMPASSSRTCCRRS
ncbi:MAG: hypothetical protein HY371_01540 [Devosia nanyangense]|nr:hypothetical protein [Devosia nanyangense]